MQNTPSRAPRYTSYPTSPHFHSGVGEKQYSSWLQSLPAESTLSLYLHVLYCQKLCWFCGCNMKISNNYQRVTNYLKLLKQEIALVAKNIKTFPVSHLHFGGGSPTILQPSDFDELMFCLRENFAFSDDTNINLEIDPRTITLEKIISYAQNKVTRASIGVQDFNLKVQQAINRIQDYELVKDVVSELRNQGIKAINLDLIYGLPYQTLAATEDTIEKSLTLKPDRISLFGYAHVPWLKKHQKLITEGMLPNREERVAMYNYASNMLTQAGYIAIGLDHFAKPSDSMAIAAKTGTLKRNFQGYTTDTASALLGFGVSAISANVYGYAQNNSNLIDYSKAIEANKLPIVKGFELTTTDKIHQEIIMSLMCNMQAKVETSIYSAKLERLKPYLAAKDIYYANGTLVVTHQARTKLRLIAAIFDDYFVEKSNQHSQAE